MLGPEGPLQLRGIGQISEPVIEFFTGPLPIPEERTFLGSAGLRETGKSDIMSFSGKEPVS